MKLSEIATHFRLAPPQKDIDFQQLSINSTALLNDSAFLAMQGAKLDGHQFIQAAFKSGCKAVIAERQIELDKKLPYLVFPELQLKLPELAALVYPKYNGVTHLVGVTGTNGKTTISTIIRYLLEKSGKECGVMGTISCWDGKKEEEASHTTPPTTDIFRYLNQCAENKLEYCAMEVSSHALKQDRLGTIKFKVGIFTNLTQDHLDYHQTMQDYEKSKLKLLGLIEEKGLAIVVGDNAFGETIAKVSKGKVLRIGKAENAEFRINDIELAITATRFNLIVKNKTYFVKIPLIGEHNIYNCMQAVACLHFLGFDLEKLLNDLNLFGGVAGRLEKVKNSSSVGPSVFVDYAHTPDAMDNVLKSVVGLKGKGRLWVVFGCGGDRDRTKRPLMAKSAEHFGDKVIVTSDNPRTEDAESIISEIKVGFLKTNYTAIADRRKAIEYAVLNANEEDMILLLGKGHEDYQIIGKEKHHFDDKEEAAKALAKRVSKK